MLKLGVVDNVKKMKEKSERDGNDTNMRGEKMAETYPSDNSNPATISPSKGITEGVSVLRERGTKNPIALPYKMYSQQASSYYGRDVRNW